MARSRHSSQAETATTADPQADAIDRLTAELRVLREAIDDFREDFSWVTRNGLPIQPIEHAVVRQMARDPCAADWGDKLKIDRFTFPADAPTPAPDADPLDRIADQLEATFEAVAKGQIEIVLTALDDVGAEILAALERRMQPPATVDASPSAAEHPAPTTAADQNLPDPRRRGRLF